MRRVLFYFVRFLAFMSRAFSGKLYMTLIMFAHSLLGVNFKGKPEYIHTDAFLDGSGGLTVSRGVVISTRVIILTHDWSFLKRIRGAEKYTAYKSVSIGENSFIGAGSIILPGTVIGKNCIIGAGSVVKGNIEDFSIVVGNPGKLISRTD